MLDKVPRKLTIEQHFGMQVLSNQTVKLLELRLKNYEIEHRIQDSLQQQDNLQTLLLSQSKILGYVAHDVRNPLSSLRSIIDLNYLQVLSEEEVKHVMGLLKKQLDATLDTLNNVIEWGQAQLYRQAPHIRPVDLHKVVTRKLENFEGCEGGTVKIRNDILCPVKGRGSLMLNDKIQCDDAYWVQPLRYFLFIIV